LKKCVKSYEEQIDHPIKIIFHDVASTYKPLLEYLEEKSKEGYVVYRSKINRHTTVMDSVVDYLKKHPECKYYVITDPDVELDNVNSDILDFYIHVLKAGKNDKLVVGPMLRIDNIPNYYPHKAKVFNRQNHFWKKKPIEIKYKNINYKVVSAPIDTTFQLVSANNLTRRFPRNGVRCYAPYSAQHLDWYIDPNSMTDDQKYYSQTASNVTHWGKMDTSIH
jgi:hypothetical protein